MFCASCLLFLELDSFVSSNQSQLMYFLQLRETFLYSAGQKGRSSVKFSITAEFFRWSWLCSIDFWLNNLCRIQFSKIPIDGISSSAEFWLTKLHILQNSSQRSFYGILGGNLYDWLINERHPLLYYWKVYTGRTWEDCHVNLRTHSARNPQLLGQIDVGTKLFQMSDIHVSDIKVSN